MKSYWHIAGPRNAPRGQCIAFYKYDGNNIRAEYSRKRGWYKFGTRTRLMDETDPEYGIAISLFLNKYGDPLVRAITDSKEYRGVENIVAFSELHGPSSFCGLHVPGEELTTTLFDVVVNKRGIMLPRDFVSILGHLDIPPVIYEGELNQEFIEQIRAGIYPVKEGVVAKGTFAGRKSDSNLWMCKIKTNWWLDELHRRASQDDRFIPALRENLAEQ